MLPSPRLRLLSLALLVGLAAAPWTSSRADAPDNQNTRNLKAAGYTVHSIFQPNFCAVIVIGDQQVMAAGISGWTRGARISGHDQMVQVDRILNTSVLYAKSVFKIVSTAENCHFMAREVVLGSEGVPQDELLATFDMDRKTWQRIDWSRSSFTDVLKVVQNLKPSDYAMVVQGHANEH
jgi:hypothetical protein